MFDVLGFEQSGDLQPVKRHFYLTQYLGKTYQHVIIARVKYCN